MMEEADFDIDDFVTRASCNKPPFSCPLESCRGKFKSFPLFKRHMDCHRPSEADIIDIPLSPRTRHAVTTSPTGGLGKRNPTTNSGTTTAAQTNKLNRKQSRNGGRPTMRKQQQDRVNMLNEMPSTDTQYLGQASLSYADSRSSVFFTLECSPLLNDAVNGNQSTAGAASASSTLKSKNNFNNSATSIQRTCRCNINIPLRLTLVNSSSSTAAVASLTPTDEKKSTTIKEENVNNNNNNNKRSSEEEYCSGAASGGEEQAASQGDPPSSPTRKSKLQSAATTSNKRRKKRRTVLSRMSRRPSCSKLPPPAVGGGTTSTATTSDSINDINNSSTPSASVMKPRSNITKGELLSVPIPKFNVDTEFPCGKRPSILDQTNYYRHQEKSNEELYETIEYQLEEEDLAWLKLMNDKRRKQHFSPVAEKSVEFLIDRFEKECILMPLSPNDGKTGLSSSHQRKQQCNNSVADEDAICEVCLDGTCENTNVILFCDVCNLAVHQECYGVPYIPEGPWLCRKCIHSPSQPVQCALCPNVGGAFKRTSNDKWAHVVCALWIPEVIFANLTFLEPIERLEKVDPKRIRLKCYICNQRNVGACIQCHKNTCYKAFHVTCAQQAGLYMRFENSNTQRGDGMRKRVFCDTHAPPGHVKQGGVKQSMFAYSDEDEENRQQQQDDSEENLKRARRILKARRDSKPAVAVPVLHLDKFKIIVDDIKMKGKKEFLHSLFSFWQLKRETRRGVPLLKRLQACGQRHYTAITTNDDEARQMSDQLNFLQRLRQDLEKARLLCELIRKRERMKRDLFRLYMRATDITIQPFVHLLRSLLDELQRFDDERIFAEPVSVRLAPDYYSVIQHPMDLSTMRRKVNNHEYDSLDEVKKDFDLMIANCRCYNRKQSIYYEAANKLAAFGATLFQDVAKIIKETGYNESTGLFQIPPPMPIFNHESLLAGFTINGQSSSHDAQSLSSNEQISAQQSSCNAVADAAAAAGSGTELNNVQFSSTHSHPPPPQPSSSLPLSVTVATECPMLLNKEELSALKPHERRRKSLTPQRQLMILTEKMERLSSIMVEQEQQQQQPPQPPPQSPSAVPENLQPSSEKRQSKKIQKFSPSNSPRRSRSRQPSTRLSTSSEILPPSPGIVLPTPPPPPPIIQSLSSSSFGLTTRDNLAAQLQDTLDRIQQLHQYFEVEEPINQISSLKEDCQLDPETRSRLRKNTRTNNTSPSSHLTRVAPPLPPPVAPSISTKGDSSTRCNASTANRANGLVVNVNIDAGGDAVVDRTKIPTPTALPGEIIPSPNRLLRGRPRLSSTSGNNQNNNQVSLITDNLDPDGHDEPDTTTFLPDEERQPTSNSTTPRRKRGRVDDEETSPLTRKRLKVNVNVNANQEVTHCHQESPTSSSPSGATVNNIIISRLNNSHSHHDEPVIDEDCNLPSSTGSPSAIQGGVVGVGIGDGNGGGGGNQRIDGMKNFSLQRLNCEESGVDSSAIVSSSSGAVLPCTSSPPYASSDPKVMSPSHSNGPPALSSLDDDDEDEEEDRYVRLQPLDVVWAKSRGFPWYPALIIDPMMPKEGYTHNGEVIPSPPDSVLQKAPAGALSEGLTNGGIMITNTNATGTSSSGGGGGGGGNNNIDGQSPAVVVVGDKNNLNIGGQSTGAGGGGAGGGGVGGMLSSSDNKDGNEKYLVLFFDTKRTWQWLTRDKLEILGVDKAVDDDKWDQARKSKFKTVDVRQAYVRATQYICKVNNLHYPYNDSEITDDCPFMMNCRR